MKQLICGMLTIFTVSSTWASTYYDLYINCSTRNRVSVKLYSGSTYADARPSILVVNDTAILGQADKELNTFTSDDGKDKAKFNKDSAGNILSAYVEGPGYSATAEKCFPTDEGGGSVSVHN